MINAANRQHISSFHILKNRRQDKVSAENLKKIDPLVHPWHPLVHPWPLYYLSSVF